MKSATSVLQHSAFGYFVQRCLRLATLLIICACSGGPNEDGAIPALEQPLLTAVHRINCGGSVVSPFSADQLASGGFVHTDYVSVSTTGVANAAPAAVYQSERYGTFSYNFGGLTPGGSYLARLHFAENKFTNAGARVFHVSINGMQVLTNFDIYANAGGKRALVLDFNTTASSSGSISVQYTSVVDNAKSSAIEIYADSGAAPPGNQPPTVASAAVATPNPTTVTTSSLAVLGADDGGEANLTYSWAASGTPPAPVTFSASGTNGAKNTTATFTRAGTYTLRATIRDAGGLSTTSSVNVAVNQRLTSILVTPASAQVTVGGTQQFAAGSRDQFGELMAPQPSVSWSVSGGGSIDASGRFTAGTAGSFSVSATSGGVTGNASLTVSSAAGNPVYQINCGGAAVSPFSVDQLASGGSTHTDYVSVSTSGVSNAAPAAVYQTERYGNHSYTFSNLTPGSNYVARLHFAENKHTNAGSRVFHVSINGAQVLSNFDIYANAGSRKALVRDFNTTASSTGRVVVQYVSVVDNAKSSAIEILSGGGLPPNQTPTVASAAGANPNPTNGTTTALAVLGADDGGEANLTYSWAATGTPPAPVSFSPNGTNAARNTTAVFGRAGSYTLAATIRDAYGASITSSVNVVVVQRPTSINVSPASAQVAPGGRQQFLATALDQFANAMAPQPSVTWTVSGGGSIDNLGSFSAGGSSGGPYEVRATSGTVSGTASVNVTGSGAWHTTDFNLTESPISEGNIWRQAGLDWTRVVTANGFAFGTQSGSNGFDDSYAYLSGTFPANQSATAIIHLEPGITALYAEVEILLRWRDSEHFSTGYECNLAFNGQYAEIIQWPGPRGTHTSQFKFISSGNPVLGGVHDGDVFQADVVGNVITSRLNGQVIATGTDDSIPSGGAPGIGFYWQGAPASQKFSFSHFSASGL